MKSSVILFVILAAVTTANAATYKLSSTKGTVSFRAKVKPIPISIDGKGDGAQGELIEKDGLLNGTISFQLSSLKTGIGLRDDHMKDKYLEVAKYPDATLRLEKVPLPAKDGPISTFGYLKVHDVEHRVQVEGQSISEGSDRKISVSFPLKLSEFKIAIPNFQGVTVADDVVVKIESIVEISP